jgi:hypothetical protein
MVTTGAAIGISFPVEPLENWNRADIPKDLARCGTGMYVSHVDLRLFPARVRAQIGCEPAFSRVFPRKPPSIRRS